METCGVVDPRLDLQGRMETHALSILELQLNAGIMNWAW